MQMQRIDLWTQQGKARVGQTDSSIDIYALVLGLQGSAMSSSL